MIDRFDGVHGAFASCRDLLLASGILSREAILSREIRQVFILTVGILFTAVSRTEGGRTFFLGGDSIGATSSYTDNTGGFTAVQQDDRNLGEPAVEVYLTGKELLTEVRVVLFGLPSASGQLLFSNFDYRLEFWKSEDYFNSGDPQFAVQLGDPVDVNFVADGPTNVVPEQAFGTAGPFGGSADTYDFHFDLTALPAGGPFPQIFESPLEAGQWVIAFQSWHDVDEDGVLRVAGSLGPVGPIPLFSRDNIAPRGILGGQDPNNIVLRWGVSLTAKIPIQGDVDGNDTVDDADLALWNSSFGIDDTADTDSDNDSDGADFLQWQRTFGIDPLSPRPGDFDLDNGVDHDDLALWSASFGAVGAADADDDGDSDGADFLTWQRGFRATPRALDPNQDDENVLDLWEKSFGLNALADADGDGDTDGADFLTWQREIGASSFTALDSGSIPEPASLLLWALAILCLMWFRSLRQGPRLMYASAGPVRNRATHAACWSTVAWRPTAPTESVARLSIVARVGHVASFKILYHPK